MNMQTSACDDDPRQLPLSVLFTASRTPQVTTAYYAQRASHYNKEAELTQYRCPEVVAELCSKYVPDHREQFVVLCVGTGSGLEGVELKQRGFKRLHAQDGCAKMLELARNTGAFQEDFCEFLHTNQPCAAFQTNSYDVVVVSGSILPGCLESGHLDELLRITKVGGLNVIGVKDIYTRPLPQYNWHSNVEDKIQRFIQDGKIRLLERHVIPDWDNDNTASTEGVFYVYKKSKE